MSQPAANLVGVDPASDVAAQDADGSLRCPLCDYDLRGLTEHRCPECGHAFDPVALRAAGSSGLRWFFEHAHRPLWLAFLRTTLRSLAPPFFWRALSPAHRVQRGRLRIWTAAWLALWILLVLATLAASISRYRTTVFFLAGPSGTVRPTAVTVSWPAATRTAFSVFAFSTYGCAFAALALWPFVARLAIGVFAVTLRRSGVAAGHLTRCTRYAMPSMMLAAVVVLLLDRYDMTWPFWGRVWASDFLIVRTLVWLLGVQIWGPLIAAWLASSVHLVFAFTRYLKLPQPILTAMLAQTVAWLAILVAVVLLRHSTL